MTKKLAGNCLFTQGYKMNLVFDIQNSAWYHIEESEYDLLKDNIDKPMKEYLEAHGIILEVPNFLLDSLPLIDTSYQSPQLFEGLVIDISKISNFNIPSILKNLDYLNLVSLQLRFFHSPDINYLRDIINCLDTLTIESSEIILPFSKETLELFEIDDFILNASKVFRVFFHSVNPNSTFEKSKIDKIYYSSEIISDHKYCGQVSALNFSSNPKHLFKSINYNSCLYKKIGIDVHGNIKNCPSLTETIANVDDLNNIQLDVAKFKTGLIKKDEIEVCSVCEFRHICTDCRAFTDSTSRPNARPSKCKYNPYIAKWSHEDGYKTLAECGVTSNEKEFSIDHEKIASINKELWGE